LSPMVGKDSHKMRWPRYTRELAAIAALGVGAAVYFILEFWIRHITPQLGAVCIVAALLCASCRLWFAGVGWAAAAALCLYQIVPDYLPHRAEARDGCMISVVTFNKLAEPSDDQEAARSLERLKPDVIFIQKVDSISFRDVLLNSGFAGYYSSSGQGLILSRFPVVRITDQGQGSIDVADIVVEGQLVRLVNMYAPRPTNAWPRYANGNLSAYLAYYAKLNDKVRGESKPLIVAGDGNATEFTAEIERLQHILRDSWHERGFGLGATFPGPWRRAGAVGPWMRLDYIFHNASFDTTEIRRINDATGAGHYPLWAKLVLVGAGKAGIPCK
jgi:endonuclease/exonuclease/phosphatase (EEP) superfamily protein YafD